METKRRLGGPRKEATPATVVDLGSTHGEAEYEDTQSKKDREIERLRLEIQRLHEEGTRGRSQSSSIAFPTASTAEQRVAVGERIEESRVSLREFLRYDTSGFRGKDGEDPQGFLRETEKVVKRLELKDRKLEKAIGKESKIKE